MSRSAIEKCAHCGAENRGELLMGNNDGEVDIETTACAHPGCDVDLCPNCRRFICDGCGGTVCPEHTIHYAGMWNCPACFADLEEPDCACVQTDVDLFDARDCEACNRNSDYNRAMRKALEVA